MSLKKRVEKVEKRFLQTEEDYYGQFWKEFFDADPQALETYKELTKFMDEKPPAIPFWYLPGQDDLIRRFAWQSRNDKELDAAFCALLERLKKFVDAKSGGVAAETNIKT